MDYYTYAVSGIQYTVSGRERAIEQAQWLDQLVTMVPGRSDTDIAVTCAPFGVL